MPDKSIPKTYEPKKVEDSIYKKWECSGLFKPDLKAHGEPFSVSMPPPNATGILHIGHATFVTLQDIMARYARMNGRPTLWLPGTDHAAIATEARVEKNLIKNQNKTKHDLGRKKFLDEVNTYVAISQDTIKKQIRKMGASCDWSRERYTLDSGLSRCVQEVFVKMYNDGLIYRGHRIVNWCTRCQSTLADDEVEYKENNASMYTFVYDKDFPIPIATVRPETKLGDTAVAVHPNDKRYKKYIGKEFDVDFLGTKLHIKVIADKSIDMKFGTGALGVTPAHSMSDAELAKKNNLPTIPVIGENGLIKSGFGKFSGLPVLEARLAIAEALKDKELLKDSSTMINNLSVCYRCEMPIEPLVSEQWFVDVDKSARQWKGKKQSLKQISLDVVKSGDIDIIPDRFKKNYFHWMENLHDWCISRQIWFGHRIPVWYCKTIDKKQLTFNQCDPIISIEKPKQCPQCSGKSFEQESDTLDTWFSSALWTFSTLLDKPKKNDTLDSWIKRNKKKGTDLDLFHPTSVLETAYEILFFWVARMILMTTYVMGEVPFKTVYLHGLVRDKLGRKMSKSLDNGIDPLDMIEKYGTDAVRLSLVIGTTPGNDMRMYEEKIAGYRNFVNKIWNIARFILMTDSSDIRSATPIKGRRPSDSDAPTLADQWIQSRLQTLIQEVNEHYNKYEFSLAGEKIYDFLWHELADWYVEISKTQSHTLAPEILLDAIKLLHPFTPFITEEIYQQLKSSKLIDAKDEFLASSKWPEEKRSTKRSPTPIKGRRPSPPSVEKIKSDFKALQSLITTIRDMRAKYNLPYSEKLDAAIATKKHKDMFQEQELVVEALTKVRIQVLPTKPVEKENFIKAHSAEFDVYIKINAKQIEKQGQQIEKEKQNLEQYIASLEKKLSNKNFTQNAPKEIVAQEQKKLEDAQSKLKKI